MLIQGRLALACLLLGNGAAESGAVAADDAAAANINEDHAEDRRLYYGGSYHDFQFRRDIYGRNQNEEANNKRAVEANTKAKKDDDDGGSDGGERAASEGGGWSGGGGWRSPTDPPTPSPVAWEADGWGGDEWFSTPDPTRRPTRRPTKTPTKRPSWKPSRRPSYRPTKRPTKRPTRRPTRRPTKNPTGKPSWRPSYRPTRRPTPHPTEYPTPSPTVWSGDEWSAVPERNKCRQAERDACCSQNESETSWDERNEVCDLLGCNLKKCGKRNAGSGGGGEDDMEWRGDEHGDDWGSPTVPPTLSPDEWKGDDHGRIGDEDGKDKCTQVERDECCNLPDNLSYYRKEVICNNLGCNIKKCGKRKDVWSGDVHELTESPTGMPTFWDGSIDWDGDGHDDCLMAEMGSSNGDRFPDATGHVKVCFKGELSETSGSLKMRVENLRENTIGGVHVHEGTSCADADSQGGHYFNPDTAGDPWFNTPNEEIAPDGTGYYADDDGTGRAGFLFDQGYGYGDTIGRVVVVHDTIESLGGDYARIACGVLEAGGDWEGDLWDDEEEVKNKCKQAERDVCCSQDEYEASWEEREEVCDFLGCNLKKCGKRNAGSGSGSGDAVVWKGDEWKKPPTTDPTLAPSTDDPTKYPTDEPTMNPTGDPTKYPTDEPTMHPTDDPTKYPTDEPTMHPTDDPTKYPTDDPTKYPTDGPTMYPSMRPSGKPTKYPTPYPTKAPTDDPVTANLVTANPTEWNGDDWGSTSDGDSAKCRSAERAACCNQDPNRRSWGRRKEVCELLGCKIKKCGKRDGDDEEPDSPGGGQVASAGGDDNADDGADDVQGSVGDVADPGVTDLASLFPGNNDNGGGSVGGVGGGVGGDGGVPADHYRHEESEDCEERRPDAANPDVCVEVCTHLTKIFDGDALIDETVKSYQRTCGGISLVGNDGGLNKKQLRKQGTDDDGGGGVGGDGGVPADHYRHEESEDCEERRPDAANPDVCVEVCTHLTKIFDGDALIDETVKSYQRTCGGISLVGNDGGLNKKQLRKQGTD